ncbi:MAG: rhomboid family intramembrane serine protease [Bacteroidetes bacterium]|nr:rhomboid family intramembrane serine protease [Bacteroidota bacterium]
MFIASKGLSIILLLMLLTIVISVVCFNSETWKSKLTFFPYRMKRKNEIHRIISHIFIHADFQHLAFNMLSVYFLGSFLEYQWRYQFGPEGGALHIAILYFFGGIFATGYLFYKHQDNVFYQSLGASGAVSAVIFAAIFWHPTMKLGLLFIPVPIPAFVFGPVYLLIEYLAMRRGNTGIAHEAHIGGALFGILYVTLLEPNKLITFFELIF